ARRSPQEAPAERGRGHVFEKGPIHERLGGAPLAVTELDTRDLLVRKATASGSEAIAARRQTFRRLEEGEQLPAESLGVGDGDGVQGVVSGTPVEDLREEVALRALVEPPVGDGVAAAPLDDQARVVDRSSQARIAGALLRVRLPELVDRSHL